MQNGWIKLHRKILENEVFRYDRTSWHIFEVLLILANHQTGKWSGGVFQLSELAGLTKNTTYKATLRLENQGMITRLVNGRYTVYHICKWGEYQSKSDEIETPSKLSVNSEETPDNTLTRSKELRIKNNTKVLGKAQFGNSDVNTIMDCFQKNFGVKPTRIKANRQAAYRLLLKLKTTESVCRIIKYSSSIQGDKYSPTIGNLIDIEDKLLKLVAHSKTTEKGKVYNAG